MSTKLKRITTQYVPYEDRLRLTGADGAGGTLTLWITQRLLNRLVEPLCKGLEQQTQTKAQTLGASSIPLVQTHLVQTFAQQKAVAALPQSGPVVPAPASASWLVETVVIKRLKNGIGLTFKGLDGAQCAVLTLTSVELRQWLGIVFKQSKSAAWPTQVWPAWLEEAAKASKPVKARSLH